MPQNVLVFSQQIAFCHLPAVIPSRISMVILCYTGSSTANSLRIWEREGCELHAIGKAPQGLHPVLAWQPNGRHLYAAHLQGNHHRVALYEANGLEHGGFDLPFREGDSPSRHVALQLAAAASMPSGSSCSSGP